jgi:hypothetical protein
MQLQLVLAKIPATSGTFPADPEVAEPEEVLVVARALVLLVEVEVVVTGELVLVDEDEVEVVVVTRALVDEDEVEVVVVTPALVLVDEGQFVEDQSEQNPPEGPAVPYWHGVKEDWLGHHPQLATPVHTEHVWYWLQGFAAAANLSLSTQVEEDDW